MIEQIKKRLHYIESNNLFDAHYINDMKYLIGEVEEEKRYKSALRKIVCLNIHMPDEVFNIANDALERKDNS